MTGRVTTGGVRLCKIDGCDRANKARGWCAMHWTRWRRHGDPETVKGPPIGAPRECKVDDCGRPSNGQGMCGTHRYRLLTYGDVLAEVPVGAGPTALQAAADDLGPDDPTCVDCGGEPLCEGFARCLECFQVWVDERRQLEKAQRRRAGIASARARAA